MSHITATRQLLCSRIAAIRQLLCSRIAAIRQLLCSRIAALWHLFPPRFRRIASLSASILFFPAAILYHELLLRAFDRDTAFFAPALLRILLFSAAAGLLIFLLVDLLPRRTARIAAGAVIGIGTVLFCVERGCRATFGLYYGVTFMGRVAQSAVKGFGGTILQAAWNVLAFVLLSLVPLAAFLLLRQKIFRTEGQAHTPRTARLLLAAAVAACQLAGWALSAFGGAARSYTYDFTPNTGIPCFGVVSSVRLEFTYRITGTPVPPLHAWTDTLAAAPAAPDGAAEDTLAAAPDGPAEDAAPAAGPGGSANGAAAAAMSPGRAGTAAAGGAAAGAGTAEKADEAQTAASDSAAPSFSTEPNVLEIDFDALAEAETNETIRGMHRYFGSLVPSEKNAYTGLFRGKNLILITAESFSTPAIDEVLTPTLYRLTHEGFVFRNFYQPDWTQSTCGGEFSVVTGLIPNWISGCPAAQACIGNRMPITLARLFAPLGYSVPAWHNGIYTYYDRNLYLSTFGYSFEGCDGGGLELPSNGFPRSDLEMMEATADSYIDDYVENGVPFHAYYMTISGHGGYSWGGNEMSAKHRAAVEARYPALSETAQAYLACNMELDLALECLVEKLEAAGIADDTLIVMTGDHYPYMMITGDHVDHYNELRGFEDTENVTSRYRNTLLMWCGGMEEPVIVDTPCSSIDIVPTLCNLFGLDYDSRLYSGRDIFAGSGAPNEISGSMPLVVFYNSRGEGSSWITAAGAYECSTGVFTPAEGVTVDEAYIEQVHRMAAAKLTCSMLTVQYDYYKYVFPDGA